MDSPRDTLPGRLRIGSALPALFLAAWFPACLAQVSAADSASAGPTSANAYLERLQRIVNMQYGRFGPKPSRTEIEVLAAEEAQKQVHWSLMGKDIDPAERMRLEADAKKDVLREIDEAIATLPTPYTDWRSYVTTRKYASKIHQAGKSLGHKVTSPLSFGDLPTVCANAMALRVPGSQEKLIVVKAGAFKLAWQFRNLLRCPWTFGYSATTRCK